jgi:integrase
MGLFRRGRVWWISFVYRGKQYRQSTETSNRKLAKRIFDKVKGEIAEGKWFEKLPGAEETFKELMKKYMEEHSPKKSPKQHIRDMSCLGHLLPYFGDYYLTEISPRLVNAYKVKRYQEKASPGTINRDLGLMRHAFNMAIREWEWISDNPLKRVSMEKEPPGRVRYLSDEEFDRLHNACCDWLKPIVLVARHTGLRRKNILSLTWNQIDLSRRVILLEHTKNRERLGMPLNETLMALFKRLSKVRHIRSSYIFCRPDGKRYVEIKGAFQRALREAGIEDLRFHDLRHCFASALVQRGVDLYQVQRLLGHKDGRMTQRYAHLSLENLRDAVLKLDIKQEHRKNLSQF